jgi:hypothetical protein
MVSVKRAGGVDRRFARPPRVACQSVGATQYFDPAAVNVRSGTQFPRSRQSGFVESFGRRLAYETLHDSGTTALARATAKSRRLFMGTANGSRRPQTAVA